MTVGVLSVAQKKTPAVEVPPGDGPKPIAIAVRGTAEWKAWTDRLREFTAKKLGVAVSLNALVGVALASYAKAIGFNEEAPER